MVQAEPSYRGNLENIDNMFVRTSSGEMAPITEFISIKRVYGPESISRFNMYTAISVTGAPNFGYSTGDAIKAVQEVAAQTLPQGYGYEFSGLTREEIASGNQSILILLLSVVFRIFPAGCAVRKLYFAAIRSCSLYQLVLQVHSFLLKLWVSKITSIFRFR